MKSLKYELERGNLIQRVYGQAAAHPGLDVGAMSVARTPSDRDLVFLRLRMAPSEAQAKGVSVEKISPIESRGKVVLFLIVRDEPMCLEDGGFAVSV